VKLNQLKLEELVIVMVDEMQNRMMNIENLGKKIDIKKNNE